MRVNLCRMSSRSSGGISDQSLLCSASCIGFLLNPTAAFDRFHEVLMLSGSGLTLTRHKEVYVGAKALRMLNVIDRG